MGVDVGAQDRAAERASAARLLAAWWSRPTAPEREEWAAGWNAAYDALQAFGLPEAPVDELHDALETSDLDGLIEEYERLLVGPGRAPCPPYESLWRTDASRREQGRLMGESASEVVRLYRRVGLRVRPDARELPDHLVVEWEALAYAFERDDLETAEALAVQHLGVWMPLFCAAVAAETTSPFYLALADLTPDWTAALAA